MSAVLYAHLTVRLSPPFDFCLTHTPGLPVVLFLAHEQEPLPLVGFCFIRITFYVTEPIFLTSGHRQRQGDEPHSSEERE